MLYYLWTRLLGLIWFIPNMTFRFEFSFSVLSFFFGFDFFRYGIFSSFRKREWIKLKRKNWIELKTVFFLVFGWAPFLGGFSQKLFSEMVCQTWFVSAFVLSGFENKKQVLETMPTPHLQHSLSIFFSTIIPILFLCFSFSASHNLHPVFSNHSLYFSPTSCCERSISPHNHSIN